MVSDLKGIRIKMAKEKANKIIAHLKGLVISAFDFARAVHIEIDFREAAEGEGSGDSGGYHGFHKGILPGVRDAILVDGRQNVILREMRANSANFTHMHLSKG